LLACQALLVQPEFLQVRCIFDLPPGQAIPGGWLRLRRESDRVALTLKVVAGQTIEGQQEVELQVDDFQQAETLLGLLGCRKRAYQESKRERWKLDGVEITLDTWPFLRPFVEVEGPSEEAVQEICERLRLVYQDALFCAVDRLYVRQYGIAPEIVNQHIPILTFASENPFLQFASSDGLQGSDE
jgi:adenylate cyclase class 2